MSVIEEIEIGRSKGADMFWLKRASSNNSNERIGVLNYSSHYKLMYCIGERRRDWVDTEMLRRVRDSPFVKKP